MLANRRRFLQTCSRLAGLSILGLHRLSSWAGAAEAGKAVVGAIRWDAWYAPDSRIGRAVEKTLGPQRYHWRLPFFAHVDGTDHVTIDGAHQAIMDQEIELAAQAGLDYWAFDAYDADNEMSVALGLYLQSPVRDRIHFCMLSGLDLWRHPGIIARHVALMCEPVYQRVLNERPLYYLGFIKEDSIANGFGGAERLRALMSDVRASARKCGAGDPYIVILDGDVSAAAKYASLLGADAIGTYQVNNNRHHASFTQQQADAAAIWDAQRATGLQVIPIVTTGIDRRPRFDNPVPWENEGKAPPPSVHDIYTEAPTPEQLAVHLKSCLTWLSRNSQASSARVALIYAWNENDEGGWLIPTYPFDRSRIDALGRVLRPSG